MIKNSKFKTKYKLSSGKILIGLLIILLVFVAVYIKQNPSSPIYLFLKNTYSAILMLGAEILLKLTNINFLFDYQLYIIQNAEKIIKINAFFYSLNQIALLLLIVLITPSPYKSKIFYFSAVVLIYILYNIVRITIHSLYPETLYTKNWLFNLLLIPQWIILIAFIDFYWQKYPAVKNLMIKKYKIQDSAYKSFIRKLYYVVVIYYLMMIVIYNNIFIINGELLVHAILKSSNYFINLFGHDTILMGRTLRSSQAALYMDDSCVGINLMFLFAAFIFLMPGKNIHKLWFIPAGLIAIIAYNITRIVLIYESIANNSGKYVLPVEIHDIFTYPVLIFTFFMWTIWINKFAIKSNKNHKEHIAH